MQRFLGGVARIAVMGFVVSLLVVWGEPAQARMAPKTLADRQPVQAGPVTPGFAIDYLGVLWETDGGHDHAEGAEGASPHGEVRFGVDGVWGPWIRLTEDGIRGEGQWASGLVSAHGADAYQVRGVPAEAVKPRAVPINTTDGPLMKVGEQPRGAAHAIDNAMCRSRADWGADESLRLNVDGEEEWPTAFYDAQVMTVHHTATENDDPDPEATVRAIYRYHAVDQGWGDIGYQFLIDESGVVYEGRWSGTASASCETGGGDGSDFAHEDGTDKMVTAAHTGGWNSGNLGVALLGEFTDHPRFGADPKPEAVDALEDLLAELALRHALDPLAEVNYVNPVSGEEKIVDTIGGHRDYTATECPGERLYARLPTIRQNVADTMATSGDSPPGVTLTSPDNGTTVSGTITVTADATDDEAVEQVEFSVDGGTVGTDTDGTDGWSVTWDTTTVTDGGHTVSANATDTASQTASDSVGVTVDNGATDSMHIGDLDGTAEGHRSDWRATVTITVLDSNGQPVEAATVNGTWTTTDVAVNCTTEPNGTCQVFSTWVPKSTDSLTFTLDDVTHGGSFVYAPGDNTDPDGDSNGTTITVTKSD
jgi:hypothetical protein